MTTETVSTGDLGLDLVLGGGWRLVARLPDAPRNQSATVVIRGGPGVGKSLLALHAALALAQARDGDVAVGCVELLPTEYIAQACSARNDLLGRAFIVGQPVSREQPGPAVFCALLTDLDPASPDLVASLENLALDVGRAGGKPVVLVVDSLSEGYAIGSSASRASVDAVMKLAAQRGVAIVLCEEVETAEEVSAWAFAADTVIELGVDEQGRWLQARKHRFGPTLPGRHRLELDTGRAPAAIVEPRAWSKARTSGVLAQHGWRHDYTEHRAGIPQLVWSAGFEPQQRVSISGDLVLVTSADPGLAVSLAYALVPDSAATPQDLVVVLDPLTLGGWQQTHPGHDYTSVGIPVALGAARALHQLCGPGREIHAYRRVVIGDLATALTSVAANDWIDMLSAFAALVADTGARVPVIAYTTTDASQAATIRLANNADAVIDARNHRGVVVAMVGLRARRAHTSLSWIQDPRDATSHPSPRSLDQLPIRRFKPIALESSVPNTGSRSALEDLDSGVADGPRNDESHER